MSELNAQRNYDAGFRRVALAAFIVAIIAVAIPAVTAVGVLDGVPRPAITAGIFTMIAIQLLLSFKAIVKQ